MTAPVVDVNGRLLGRITVDDVVDVIREEADREILNLAGLREEEDLFASVWESIRNRWTWLAINLVHGVRRLARDRRVRGLDREAGGAGRADADRGRHRRQLRQPDHHPDRARARARPASRPRACARLVAEGDRRRRCSTAWCGAALLGVCRLACCTSNAAAGAGDGRWRWLLNLLLAALAGVGIPMTAAPRVGRDPALGVERA
ncbi:MAG: hypothetical protein MZW92_09675 [Comamonadaceae bacterium]|nr:hypothetical protein [Comamonadaceae bacterium]